MIEVVDSGSGIPEDLGDQLAEPFLTTKDPTEHLGMGLSVVKGIAESLEGWIAWENNPAGGACFTAYLPLSSRETIQERHANLRLEQNQGKILLVDDELLIVEAGKALLSDLGYEVDIATCPAEALNRAQEEAVPYDLIMTDLNMPGMTGLEFGKRLRQNTYTGQLVLTTGILKGITPDDIACCGFNRVLMKPCSILDLANAVKELLSPSDSKAVTDTPCPV